MSEDYEFSVLEDLGFDPIHWLYALDTCTLTEELKDSIVEHFERERVRFTKEKCKEMQEAILENVEAIDGWNTGYSGSAASVDKDSIINAYNINDIK